MKLSVTLEVEVNAAGFPEPLPIPELLRDHDLKSQALEAILKSNGLDSILRSVVAQWIVDDGGVAIAQQICNGVMPRDSHIMLAAIAQRNEFLSAIVIEKYVRQGSVDELMRQVVSRLQIKSAEVIDVQLDYNESGAATRFISETPRSIAS